MHRLIHIIHSCHDIRLSVLCFLGVLRVLWSLRENATQDFTGEQMKNEKQMSTVEASLRQGREAIVPMVRLTAAQRNAALLAMADVLKAESEAVFAANREDLREAEREGLGKAMRHRLELNEGKIETLCQGLHDLAALDDPLGQILLSRELDRGLELYRVRCPLGLIGVIFEARPDALVQIASLCVKSGNAVALKGGREAMRSNRALAAILCAAGKQAGLPDGWLTLLESREDVDAMLKTEGLLDLIIPRGSEQFVRYIMDNTRVPVLGHADGVCHTYIAADADPELALKVAVDAKTQYTSVCNATETILLHSELLKNGFAESLLMALQAKACRFHGDERLRAALGERFVLLPVENWHHEYLDLELAIKTVDSLNEAIGHINRYGSGHTEAILTQSREDAEQFMRDVDSGNVFWNCSTRFSDGFRYGFGAEVGVSTSKIHARGPVGLEGLTTYKYKLYGHGDIVADFAEGKRHFTHRDL